MTEQRKIVVLDAYTLCADELNYDALNELGSVTVYERTTPEQAIERIGDAEIILTNKVVITREIMEACPSLRYVGVTATGFNIVDIEEAKKARHCRDECTGLFDAGSCPAHGGVSAGKPESCCRV